MKIFISLVYKELLHILRDPISMFISLLAPTLLTMIFSYTISVDIRNINIATVVNQTTEYTQRFVSDIQNSEYFTFVGNAKEADVQQLMRSGKIDAAVFFGDNNDIQILLDGSNTVKAQNANIYIKSVIAKACTDSASASMFNLHLLHNPQMLSSYQFVPGTMGLIFIMICCLMTSVSIVKEREQGSMNLLIISSVRPSTIILSKIVPYFCLSVINLFLMLIMSYYVVDIPINGSLTAIVLVSLLYIILSLILGMVVSAISRTQVDALLTSLMSFMLPFMLFSGMIYPIENMPEWLQPVSIIIPARWYIDAIRKLMIEGLPFSYTLFDVGILLIMTVVLLAVALFSFKSKSR